MTLKPPVFLLFLAFVLFAGCSKWEEEPVISQLLIVNAFPDAASLNIRVNTDAESILDFGAATPYQPLRAGQSTLQVNIGDRTLRSGYLRLAENRNYSLYILKGIENPDLSINRPDSIIIRIDTLPAPEVGRAKIRFANLTPLSEGLDLRLRVIGPTNDTVILPARTSPNYTPFSTVDASARGFSLSLLRGTEVAATLSIDTLASERTYTIIATGYSTPPPGNPRGLTLRVVANRLERE
ncbi:DUF4397 domain-containing protein [Rhodocytophaga aerolata]|uniref:DUF4397 domain-containing protein n=2 Tax=Rhodocytophaga aerolata TaxID=455078 RepID=A0ABT8R0J6_9BACT|nr:DUF4397 domain-containing protein [Rhodocytophaga aerolata]MDO1445607.1 DUF4397 domain-containing protein [Rhodocytophaga aerolata]